MDTTAATPTVGVVTTDNNSEGGEQFVMKTEPVGGVEETSRPSVVMSVSLAQVSVSHSL